MKNTDNTHVCPFRPDNDVHTSASTGRAISDSQRVKYSTTCLGSASNEYSILVDHFSENLLKEPLSSVNLSSLTRTVRQLC